MDPLPVISRKPEVSDTADHILETFYPVSPTIDLQKVHVYKEKVNCKGKKIPGLISPCSEYGCRPLSDVFLNLPGFTGDYAYPHAHTLYFLEGADARCKLRPEQFKAKMIMFSFGNALAHAHMLYGVSICTDAHLTSWRLQATATHLTKSFKIVSKKLKTVT